MMKSKWQWLSRIYHRILRKKCVLGGRKAKYMRAASSNLHSVWYLYLHSLHDSCQGQPTPGGAETWGPLQVFSHSGPVPAACYMEPSLPVGYDFGDKSFCHCWMHCFSFDGKPRWINMKAFESQETTGREQNREQSEMTALPHSSISYNSTVLL